MTETAIYAALDALGSTPAEVAATLANKGIRGHRGSMATCPLARYLRTQGLGAFPLGGIPEAAGRFMLDFDFGCYPDLEQH